MSKTVGCAYPFGRIRKVFEQTAYVPLPVVKRSTRSHNTLPTQVCFVFLEKPVCGTPPDNGLTVAFIQQFSDFVN